MAEMTIHSGSTRLGMGLCIAALLIFAAQDGITKVLIRDYHPAQFIMIRYWVFAIAVMLFAVQQGQLKASLFSNRPILQIVRSALLIAEMVVFAAGLSYLGLAEMHALFATFPLITTAMAALFLRETVGWYRRMAVLIGFLGALLIIKPGMAVFQPAAFIGLIAALMFAAYTIITRFVSQQDSPLTALVYMAVVGSVLVTPFGIANWQIPDNQGWALMAILSITGLAGHVLLVKALQLATASALQPLNYLIVAFATIIGVGIFGERPDIASVLGTLVIVGSGLFAMFRERVRKQQITAVEP